MSYDVREKTEVPNNFGKNNKKSHFPYKSLKDPKYIKDKKDIFKKNGNGWWWDNDTTKTRKPLSKRPKKGTYNG